MFTGSQRHLSLGLLIYIMSISLFFKLLSHSAPIFPPCSPHLYSIYRNKVSGILRFYLLEKCVIINVEWPGEHIFNSRVHILQKNSKRKMFLKIFHSKHSATLSFFLFRNYFECQENTAATGLLFFSYKQQ